jgi:hypothetical protein
MAKEELVRRLGALAGNQRQTLESTLLCGPHLKWKIGEVMVDTNASHNFLRKELARELGLRMRPFDASIKVVNSKEKRQLLGL